MIDEEKSDSEKITELDLLLEEMLTDARRISFDLTEGITNTKAASILGFVITIIQLLILRDNWYRGPMRARIPTQYKTGHIPSQRSPRLRALDKK
jgi:hypothetical protein